MPTVVARPGVVLGRGGASCHLRVGPEVVAALGGLALYFFGGQLVDDPRCLFVVLYVAKGLPLAFNDAVRLSWNSQCEVVILA